jgi:phage baseplate assembly protein W
VSSPSAAEVDRVLRLLGTDLALDYPGSAGWWEDADLAVAMPPDRFPHVRDLAVAAREAAADQLLVNRLKTQQGELASLGHPQYGSRHHELLGEPNTERTRALIKMHVLEALSHEPRIERVLRCEVTAAHDPPRDVVRIDLLVRLHRQPVPHNLVVPFSLSGPLEGSAP